MIFKDYYKILGLDSSKVSIEQIKESYRDLAKKYHPDVNIDDKKAEERFKDINESYRVLSDTIAKKKYDRIWNAHVGRKTKSNKTFSDRKRSKDNMFAEFFKMFFGDYSEYDTEKISDKVKGKSAIKGENIETELKVSIEEAFNGSSKNISLRTIDGKMKTFKVIVPEGIMNNEKVRLIGQGKEGQFGGKNGDLLIKIKVENNKDFKLEGYNLRTNLYLSPWEAALGTKIGVKGIKEEISVYVPAGIQSGEEIKIPQKGYKNGKGNRGDLIVEAKIMVPRRLAEKEKKLFEKFKEVSNFNPRIC